MVMDGKRLGVVAATLVGALLTSEPTSASSPDQSVKAGLRGNAGARAGEGEAGVSIEDEAKKAVEVRLVADVAALVPGKPATLALEFRIAKGWNLYWRNAGDSGLPIGFEFQTPDGVSVGDAQWPVPTRKVLEGELLDYIYTERVVLLFPVLVAPSNSATDGRVTIRANLDWLVCREACVPGERTLELTLPIGSDAIPSEFAALLSESSRAMPQVAGSPGAEELQLRTAWREGELTIECPGATRLVWLPYELEHAWAEDMIERGVSDGATIAIPYSSGVAREEVVRGVLQATRGGKTISQIIEVTTPRGGSGAGAGAK